jgi:hypothetical protein
MARDAPLETGIMNVAARKMVTALAVLVTCALGAAHQASAQVTLTRTQDQIAVTVDGKPFTVFHIGGEHLNRVYLHPLRSAAGKVVTRSVPAGQLPGESTDHPHHAGLFYGHGDVNGYNFWAVRNEAVPPSGAAATLGRIVVKELGAVASGDKTGSIAVVLSWLRPDGKPLLTERRTMTFHAHPELRIIDMDLDLEALDDVVFGDTKEGTFAMRMATVLDEPQPNPKPGEAVRTGTLRNAQGGQGEANVWGKRSEWVDYSGRIDGAPVGVVMMDHPSNPRHPTYWHSRGYGLHAINPFGEHDFLNDKTKDGSLTIARGQRVRFRYRVVIHDGASPDRIAVLYREYAQTTPAP